MPVMNFSSLMSPSTHLSFLSSPNAQPYGYSPPSLHQSLAMSSPPSTHSSFAPSSFSPAAFSPQMFLPSDPKSLSRYRVLDSNGLPPPQQPSSLPPKVSDEHLKILATLSQLSQTNGFSSPAQPVSAFNPLPLQPPPHPQHPHPHPHPLQQFQHPQGYTPPQQQQQPGLTPSHPPQHLFHSQHGYTPPHPPHPHQQPGFTPPQPGQPHQQQQGLTPPQPGQPLLGHPSQSPGMSPPQPTSQLQQPIPVAPLSQSSLLQITPPMTSSSLLTKSSSTPSQSPPPTDASLPQSLLAQLHLILQQQIQAQAQALHQQSAPGSPPTAGVHLQQLSNLQQIASHVLATSSPQQLQQIAMVTQSNPTSLPMTLLQIAQHEERQAMDRQASGQQQQMMQLPTVASPMQPVQPLHVPQPGMPSPPYYVPGHMAGTEVDPLYVSMSEEVGPDGVRRKGKVLAGSSCHQCKTRRISAELVYCMQSHAKKGRTRKRRIEDQPSVYIIPNPATTYKAERLCRKKYCSRCLVKFYNEQAPAKIGPHGDRSWSCPGCRGLCSCAACKRQQTKKDSKKRNAAAAQAAAHAATQSAGEGSDGSHPPVFSSTADTKDPAMKSESSTSPSSDDWKSSQLKEEPPPGRSSSASEEPGLGTLAVPGSGATGSPSMSTILSPATTESNLSSVGRDTGASGSSQSGTPPTPLHGLPMSTVVTPAPVYGTLGGFNTSPGMTMSSLGSLTSSPLLPVNMSLHGLQFPSSFLSPQQGYASLSSLPMFPSSAFSSSPPSSPFPPAGHHMMLPHLGTPHLTGMGLGSMAASSASSSPSLETGSGLTSLMGLTSASPITWQRSLRVGQVPGLATGTTGEQGGGQG